MLPFRRIVYPVDYSDTCRAIAPFVKDMLERYSAQLTLVHAYAQDGLSFVDLPVATPDLPQQIRDFELARLSEYVQELFPGVQADVFAEFGEPGAVIQDVIQRQGCDLVMLPTHGRGVVRRMMLGSVAAKVLHDSSCAVWTATATALAGRKQNCRNIVCASDGTDEARSVIVAGAALAKSYGAKLSVVHVLTIPPMTMEIDVAAIRTDLLRAAQGQLRETVGQLGVDADHAVIEGSISYSIHDWLTEHKADLLVAGRGHAGEGLGRVWSNLYSIVRESPCPVLSI
jgi:nucleotide-binding universal stress UspA family protein